LHTGEAIHGNIWSSETRVNYTVIGDSVNLASRLEWVCKQYGISICVSEDVYELQKESFHFRELDLIEVKGRKKPVKIYQLLGDKKHPLSAKHIEYFERYQQALVTYQREDFALAQELFFKNKGDETSDIMWKRCQDIQNWISRLNQGVFQLHTK
jgi:adenylate cyclase